MKTMKDLAVAVRCVPISRCSGVRICDLAAVQILDSHTVVVVPFADRDSDVIAAAVGRLDHTLGVERQGGALMITRSLTAMDQPLRETLAK